jgi:hypothetical protein
MYMHTYLRADCLFPATKTHKYVYMDIHVYVHIPQGQVPVSRHQSQAHKQEARSPWVLGTPANVCMYVCMCAYACVCVYVTYVCIYMSPSKSAVPWSVIYLQICVCMCVCVRIYVCLDTYTYTYIYIYIYTHTHTHTHESKQERSCLGSCKCACVCMCVNMYVCMYECSQGQVA